MLFDRISFGTFAKIMLPTKLRNSKMVAFVKVLLSPVNFVLNKLFAKRKQTQYDLNRTSTLRHLRAVLNDRFDKEERRFDIVDGKYYDPAYIYRKAENKTTNFLYTDAENQPLYLYNTVETSQNGIDFIVLVPNVLVYDQSEMIALIDKYRAASKKNYIIQTV